MSTWEKLRKRLREECEFEIGKEFRRCYPGRHQRAAGAWSWIAPNGWNEGWNVGSQWSMTDLLKANKVVVEKDRVTLDYWVDLEG